MLAQTVPNTVPWYALKLELNRTVCISQSCIPAVLFIVLQAFLVNLILRSSVTKLQSDFLSQTCHFDLILLLLTLSYLFPFLLYAFMYLLVYTYCNFFPPFLLIYPHSLLPYRPLSLIPFSHVYFLSRSPSISPPPPFPPSLTTGVYCRLTFTTSWLRMRSSACIKPPPT
jgi:hypothetical protein